MFPNHIPEDVLKLQRILYDKIMTNREHIIEAFIAETGLFPSEIEIVEQWNPTKTTCIWSLRRKQPK